MRTKYQSAKLLLEDQAKELKSVFKNDKPAINQGINDTADWLSKNLDLTEYHRNLLHNFACTLHS